MQSWCASFLSIGRSFRVGGSIAAKTGNALDSVMASSSFIALPCCRRTFSTTRNIPELPATKRKVTGRFGVEWGLGARRPTEIAAKMTELPKPPFNPRPYEMGFSKYPGLASGLGAEYFFRDGQAHPLTYYHIRSSKSDSVVVGATDVRAREARTIDNYVKERTRGFAAQIVLEGRGVKAYFEPKAPFLKARLGVGAKVKDLTEYCKRDPDVTVYVSKKGDLVNLHGPNKARVGTLAYRLLRKMQPKLLPYTGKGAHFAFHPEKRKAVRKK